MLIYVNITDRQTDGQTDRQTHQNYSSEPHKMMVKFSSLKLFFLNNMLLSLRMRILRPYMSGHGHTPLGYGHITEK